MNRSGRGTATGMTIVIALVLLVLAAHVANKQRFPAKLEQADRVRRRR